MSSGMVDIQLPDGTYTNLLDDQVFRVLNYQMPAPASAAILATQAADAQTPQTSSTSSYHPNRVKHRIKRRT